MFKRITHIGIAVRSLKDASQRFARLFDRDDVQEEAVPIEKVKVGMFQIGETKIELIEATDPSSAIARFIEKRGEGAHHISFEVEDLDAELQRLRQQGFEILEGYPRAGAGGYRVAFLHPISTHGVLIELSEKSC